ncbi:hypothetical protein A6A04_18820 [Paramagnetospirillum marisnigri]|uniref:Uncharacterized protein n=1 Tax=Paramagnetospirillum marisnigri TaxID=1285242 RepID=A0A178MMC6_9PROT|nr:hypothetical protein [Paramagnetospirillum marisnigri]OAN49816.1 hypothetical protein A6A04_18820 [Paramagnetospirillum marisnigri]
MSTALTLTQSADIDERIRRRINGTLEGPVMTILAERIPDLARLPQGGALEAVLNDHVLLHRCFQSFRAERPRFRSMLVDRRDRPVENDNTPLACGRSVNQVIAMIVRSAAKRHFRRRQERLAFWGGTTARLAERPEPGVGGLLGWLMGRSDEIRSRPPATAKSPADQLYDAIRRYLLHDWQVPIIPQYARMTPPEVRELGSRILDFRDADQLAAWLDGGTEGRVPALLPETQPEPPASLATPVAEEPVTMPLPPVIGAAALPSAPLFGPSRARLSEVLGPDGRSLRMETMATILVRPEIKAALGLPSREELVLASRAVSRTGAATVRRLVVDFGLSAEQMAAVLASAALMLPLEVYERLFGRKGEAALILALVARTRAAGLGPDSPPDALADFTRTLFGRFRK